MYQSSLVVKENFANDHAGNGTITIGWQNTTGNVFIIQNIGVYAQQLLVP